ncbi:MAG TPA: 3-isopropylmalate dehydratase small subunit [Bacillales bacterium]|nr:3-isopropylmalate dehydratase small subunit [Bacillales bacterium]
MRKFATFTGKTAVLDRTNIDTDQIIPKQFLKRVERTGFGQFLFYDWRFHRDGSKNLSFELNRPETEHAEILLAGENFGCGSSREHAPWALADYGFKVIIAPSFADIFYNNCLKNGLLPIVMPHDKVKRLMSESTLKVDLHNQTIFDAGGNAYAFDVDHYWKDMLLKGKDEIDITLSYEKAIAAYEHSR